jgi:hypothetical protein
VKPGYLKHLVPTEAPEEPEQWKDVMNGKFIKIKKFLKLPTTMFSFDSFLIKCKKENN